MKGLIGKKLGMTQVFDEGGAVHPVTLIEAGPCFVTQVRRPDRDGYLAIQLGFGEARPKKLSGGQLGHLKRHDLPALRFLRQSAGVWTVGLTVRPSFASADWRGDCRRCRARRGWWR